MNGVGPLFLHRIIDKVGRKPLLAGSFAGMAAAMAIMAAVPASAALAGMTINRYMYPSTAPLRAFFLLPALFKPIMPAFLLHPKPIPSPSIKFQQH
jgi:MFS family permease